jgi:CheY-like chemotaxis protein
MEVSLMPDREGRALLWVDDDGPDRFLFEEFMLTRRGWKVVWATSIRDALQKLGTNVFDAILLDQMLPVDPGPLAPTDVWGGCLLLYWLRGMERPLAAPEVEEPDAFREVEPLASNRSITIVIVSAFHDDEVEEAIKSAAASIEIVKKPIDLDKLIAKLEPGDYRDV